MVTQKHNRRNFLKIAGSALFVGTAVLWDKMVRSQRALSKPGSLTIPFDPNRKISFQDDFIIINTDNHLKVFSSRCTHLGCVIRHSENEHLICPCHGSSFDLKGNPTKGPAFKSLEPLDYSVNNTELSITVKL